MAQHDGQHLLAEECGPQLANASLNRGFALATLRDRRRRNVLALASAACIAGCSALVWSACSGAIREGAPRRTVAGAKGNVGLAQQARTPGKVVEAYACAAAGENCTESQCCMQEGFQCYQKDDTWAECKPSCIPGPDPRAKDGWPWSCTELGKRAGGAPVNCSAVGEDCTHSKCCLDSGLQCYQKHNSYATCKAECVQGIDLTDEDPSPWSCATLGSRTADLAPWVAQVCAPPGASCLEKKCCSNPGMQCFEKNPYYGECRAECTEGWTCGTHGSRTPFPAKRSWEFEGKVASWVAEKCSKEGENCKDTKCCVAPGNQCFEKNSTFAVCKGGCAAGPDLYDANPKEWTCTALGPRTPGAPREAPWKLGMEVAPWVATRCAGRYTEDCTESKCCSTVGDQCYKKNDAWAACMPGCTPGPMEGDTDGNWTCEESGPRTMRTWGKPSLYCFAVIQPYGYEGPLVQAQMKAGAGIFACDEFSVFSTVDYYMGVGPLGPIHTVTFTPADVVTSKDGTAGNAELFIHVWDAVRNTGLYGTTEWTVKCDPDAVVLPDRLRGHLQQFTGTPSYIVNCAKPYMPEGPMMFGALEAMSREAMNLYYSKLGDCTDGLPWKAWGEDWFMGHCLDKIGVQKRNDFQIYSDGVCMGVDCKDPVAAAFHPKKDIGSWFACLNETGTPHDVQTTEGPQWFKDYMASYAGGR